MSARMGARVLGIGLGLLGLAACGPSERAESPPDEAAPVLVRLVVAGPEPVPLVAEAVGTVRARATVAISSALRAYVTEVHVSEGMSVDAGQLLVRLDDAEMLAQVARAEAEHEGARFAEEETRRAQAEARARAEESRAGLVEARGGVEAARRAVAEAEAAVAGADAQADLARITLGRYGRLFRERALSRQEHDEAVARERTARADADRARARLEGARATLEQAQARAAQAAHAIEAARLRIQGLESRGRGAEARVREAGAEVSRARAVLGHTRLVAPVAGIVVEKSVEVGELAMPGRVLLRLDDPSGYRLWAELAATHAGEVRVGESAPVWVDELGQRPVTGRVAEVAPAADPATRTVTVKIDLPPRRGLRSGLYGKVEFGLGTTERLMVSAGALVERGQLTGVYVATEGSVARFRLVTVGARRGDRVEILSGLDPGERIVADGVERVRDGSRLAAQP